MRDTARASFPSSLARTSGLLLELPGAPNVTSTSTAAAAPLRVALPRVGGTLLTSASAASSLRSVGELNAGSIGEGFGAVAARALRVRGALAADAATGELRLGGEQGQGSVGLGSARPNHSKLNSVLVSAAPALDAIGSYLAAL